MAVCLILCLLILGSSTLDKSPLVHKVDTLYFHSYSYFPPPYFSFASYPLTSAGSCFCCCNQCCTCVLVARNTSISATASNTNPAYLPPYYRPHPTTGGLIVNRNISTIPATAVVASSNNYNQHLLYSASVSNVVPDSTSSSTITTATTTPIKRVQDEVEDVQMVSTCLSIYYLLYA